MESITNINFQPIIKENSTYKIFDIKSSFFYIILIGEIIVTSLLIYFFFTTEVIFSYNNINFKNKFSNNDKKTYNMFLKKLQDLINTEITCKKNGNNYSPMTSNKEILKNLNNENLVFKELNDCKKILSS